MNAALDRGIGRMLGVACVLTGALMYRSYENTPVLGRWSYSFTAFLVVLVAILGVLIWRAVRTLPTSSVAGPSVARFVDVSVLLWGLAYLLSAVVEAAAGGRALDLNFVGSIATVPAALEWTSLAAAVGAVALAGNRWSKGGPAEGIALTVTTVVLLGLLGEGLARVKAHIWPSTQGFPTYSGQIWGRRYAELNSLGFRDGEHSQGRREAVRRVLLVGDSYTFGTGIKDREDRLGERLTEYLQHETGESWEAINAGMGDTHTLDHISFLDQTEGFEPDVILLIYVFNDMDYLVTATERGVLTDLSGPLQRLHPGRLLFLNSYLCQEIWVRVRSLRSRPPQGGDQYEDEVLVDSHLADLGRFVDNASRGGAKVAIVPFDTRVQLGGRFLERYLGFVEQAERQGLPMIRLHEAFGPHEYTELIVNRLDHHPNELANDLAAQYLVGLVAPEAL